MKYTYFEFELKIFLTKNYDFIKLKKLLILKTQGKKLILLH